MTIEHIIEVITPKNPGELLIIAGDISDFNEDILSFLTSLKKIYNNIIYVLGNHEYWLKDNTLIDVTSRVTKIKKITKKLDVTLLDNEYIEINGLKFYGNSMWYDFSFSKKYFNTSDEECLKIWKNQNDFKQMKKFWINKSYIDFANEKIKELNEVRRDTDVVITHIPPVCLNFSELPKSWIVPGSRNIYFDGVEQIRNIKPKYWFFGHTHEQLILKYHKTTLLCNSIDSKRKDKTKIINKIRQIKV